MYKRQLLDYSYESLIVDGTITDEDGNTVTCYLPKIGGPESLAAAGITLDTVSPSVAYSYKLKNGETYYSYYYKAQDRLGVKLSFTEPVLLKAGEDAAALRMHFLSQTEGEKEYVLTCTGHALDSAGKKDPSSLIFEYTLKDDDVMTDGDIQRWSLENTGQILDAAGNPAAEQLPAPQAYLWNLYFDSQAPQWAVSYTHLDVYKRQVNRVGDGLAESENQISNISSGHPTLNIYLEKEEGRTLVYTRQDSWQLTGSQWDSALDYIDAVPKAGSYTAELVFDAGPFGGLSKKTIAFELRNKSGSQEQDIALTMGNSVLPYASIEFYYWDANAGAWAKGRQEEDLLLADSGGMVRGVLIDGITLNSSGINLALVRYCLLYTSVTVHIKRIRKKIDLNPDHYQYIETVWGVGYRFRG